MATVTSNASNKSVTLNKNSTSGSTTITWTAPTVPTGGTITSCVLTGTISATSAITGVTIGEKSTGVSGTSGTFSVDLGTSITTSASVSITKAKGTASTVDFSNMVYTVTYTPVITYTVTFKDWDGSTIVVKTVRHGSDATAPDNPTRDGYVFTGWDTDFTSVKSDLIVVAQYTKNEEPEPEIPEGAIPVEKTVTLRPISATQDSGYNNTWTNIANTYDTDTSTNGTIIVTGSSQSGFKRKYVDTIFNFDNPIPANATINSAVLTIRAKQSATTNLNITASIDSHEVIGSTLLSSSTKDYTADVANYVKDLNQLNINLTSAATSNRTFTLYDVRIDVNYTAYEMPKPTYTVIFKDWDEFILKTQTVEEGASATAPNNPTRTGYTFIGWDIAFDNVLSDLTVTAQYEKIIDPDVPEEPEDEMNNIKLGSDTIEGMYIGDSRIIQMYLNGQPLM